MTKLRVLILFSTLLIVGTIGYFVALIARGYNFDFKNLKFSENGILVAKSEPDGASIYIDGDLKAATNTNLKLPPGEYNVEIKTDGYTTWSKKLNIKKEEVTQITAHLFRSVPSFSPVTFDGAKNPVVSTDFSKIAYQNDEGLWIMSVSSLPIGFPNEPKMITDGLIGKEITYSFSPDSRQILVETKTESYLLDTNEYIAKEDLVNIKPDLKLTLEDWQKQQTKKQESELKLLPDELAQILKTKTSNYYFSPDETMVMYIATAEAKIAENLIPALPGSSTQEENRDIKVGNTYIYDIKEDKNFLVNDNGRSLYWLPTSRHLILPDEGKIVIMDYDGTNRQTVFSGNYVSPHAYPFVNASKLLILTDLGSEGNMSNLYSLSVK